MSQNRHPKSQLASWFVIISLNFTTLGLLGGVNPNHLNLERFTKNLQTCDKTNIKLLFPAMDDPKSVIVHLPTHFDATLPNDSDPVHVSVKLKPQKVNQKGHGSGVIRLQKIT